MLGLKPIRTKATTPQTNGKAGRLIKTLLEEQTYVIAYQTSEEHSLSLPHYLGITNGSRCHVALVGLTPQQCLMQLLSDLVRKHSQAEFS